MSVPTGALLLTLDVEALYSSIPHGRGVGKAWTFLRELDHTQWKYSEFALRLLYFILTHNWFLFLDSPYFQVQGVAMGTRCAPAYTNLYLGGWERELFASETLSTYTDRALCWFRFIDFIFLSSGQARLNC